MRFAHELSYDASAAEVYAMLTDPVFREAVCGYQQVLRHSVTVEETADAVVVDVDQVQAARGIPSYARSFVGDEIDIEQRESWHSTTDAGLQVTIPGKPVHLNGTVTLRERGGRTVETVTGELKVSLPFIGSKVEGMVSDLLKLALNAEHAVGQQWLAGQD